MSLRHVILAVLSERDATGSDIAKSFEESLAFFWNAFHQGLYRDLKALEREGGARCAGTLASPALGCAR